MKNWIIRKLGGYTNQDVLDMYADYIAQISDLETKLIEARKNDKRDPVTGRYMK